MQRFVHSARWIGEG